MCSDTPQMPGQQDLTKPAPPIVLGKVREMRPPTKRPNAERRSREYLTPAEIDSLIAAARRLGRHGHRDATMILLAFRHGLRVSELVGLRSDQLNLRQARLEQQIWKMNTIGQPCH